ncbi:hypothetical protein CLHUN_01920 [Ruminiclostridium hungatei]|uniref:Uncharacterized protein n=1 Tax=Ruminiclostridium hungatei TaxID=48256 RepID=A0A1V4SSD2_RUMHU|nr:hypothetical protein [Ruminiclostridium hungatei]OPX46376.1 hypothetical protein CLHUN_01920 [Ruminiclostridium hungatei]
MFDIFVVIKAFREPIMVFLPIFAVMLVPAIIKLIIRKLVYRFALVAGDSRRSARKKSRIAGDIFDLASTAKDLTSKK